MSYKITIDGREAEISEESYQELQRVVGKELKSYDLITC